jgi:hypothetical protein
LGGISTAGVGGLAAPATVGVNPGTSAFPNSGSGGGGGGGSGPSYGLASGGAGGSGIVIIRYPSYLLPATSTTGSPETYIAGQYRVYKFVASGTITF